VAGGSYAPPGQPNQPGAFMAEPAPVLMAFAEPARQNRLTVFFRIILAIPQLAVLAVVGIAAEVVVVIGWFGALFMGRLPRFAADFLTGYLRWSARVSAYLALLTDQYPPFTFDDVGYPVRLAVQPGQLNRLAVLFRVFLAIPAEIVGYLVGFGFYTIGLFVTWLIVLFSGIMPRSLHRAIAAIVRYQTRITGYLLLVTAEYPWGLFGDRTQPAGAYPAAPGYGEPPPAPDYGQPAPGYGPPPPVTGYGQAPPAPGYGQPAPGYGEAPPAPGYGQPAPGYGEAPPAPGYGQPAPGYGEAPPAPGYGEAPPAPGYGATTPAPGYGAPGYGAPAPGYGAPGHGAARPGESGWRLDLTTGEAQLVGLFAGAGVLAWVLYAVLLGTVVFSGGGVVQRADAISQSRTAYSQLTDATRAFATTTSGCQSSAQALACVTSADRQVAQSFGTFEQTIRGISMPSASSAAAASQLASVAGQAQQVFERLGGSTSVSQYQQIVQSSNIAQLLDQLDHNYTALGAALTQ
jgi:Domain of unknown function (DUF4389)